MDVGNVYMGALDYAVVAFMLLVSASIGLYFRFAGGKQMTTEEYLLAGKNMSILPVAFSLMASLLSAIMFIGTPADIYRFGIAVAYSNIGYVMGKLISAFLSLPVFFRLQASSAYEYLARRFGILTRTVVSFAFAAQMVLYVGVVLYAPSLALSAVMKLPTWVSITLTGSVCTFYCALGGMKAVLWTDVFQAILMFLGLSTVLIKGTIDVGGVDNVVSRSLAGGRLFVPSMDFDFTKRYTLWGIILSATVYSMCSYSGNQVQIQRLLTVRNLKRSRRALLLSIPMTVSFNVLCCLAGLVLYANFYDCDPVSAPTKPIKSTDQLLPFFMMISLRTYPGLLGLCICGIFSASLSTVSSAVNSLSAVAMEDFVRPIMKSKGLSQIKAAFLAKAITVAFGMLFVVTAFLISIFENLMVASHSVYGMLGGPILGVFLLGMLTTRANERGVVVGLISAVALSAWINFGSVAHGPDPITLPVSTNGCYKNAGEDVYLNGSLPSPVYESSNAFTSTADNFSNSLNSSVDNNAENRNIFILYRLSYIWITPIGFVTSLIIGYFSSIAFHCITGETSDVSHDCLSPAVQWFITKPSTSNEMELEDDAGGKYTCER